MLDVKNVFEQRVAARLLEFFDRDVPWHRALWGPGLRLLLLEILEASEAVSAKVLTPGSLKHLMRSALSVAGKDPGLGGPKQRSLLHHSLDSDLVFRGEAYFSIEGVTREIEKKYLERWATAFDAGTQPSVERTARSIAAHLLDLGFGSDFLHRWWTYRLHYEVGQRSLTEIVADADRLCAQPEREHVALVLFEGLPTRAGVPPNWLDSEKASRWVIEHGFTVHGFRQNGGMLIRISARDPYAAVDIVRGRIEMLAARVALGLSARIKVVPKVWIEGEKHVFDLYRGRRGAEIHALRREGQIFADATTSPLLDAAVALLQSINTGTPSTAISGSWAAIETLLYSPGDEERVAAGDRLARIVACSFPRAELTHLSYKIDPTSPLGRIFASQAQNKDRARELALALHRGDAIALTESADLAALDRLTKISKVPDKALTDVVGYASAAFRRVYRCRNLILHWGRVEGEIRRACLRTTAPLIGAGVDRIAHAALIESLSPLALAARAQAGLREIKSGGADLVDLLD